MIRRRIAFIIAVTLTLATAACGSRPGFIVPLHETAPGAAIVPIVLATTRKPAAEDSGYLFNGERALRLSYAQVNVSIPPDRVIGKIQWPSRPPGNPATDFVTESVGQFDRTGFSAAVRKQMAERGQRRVLLFIHGFNTLFQTAVYQLAQLSHDSGAPAVPVLFTWPSRGEIMQYPYDRESTNVSRFALDDVLKTLADDPGVSEITILAHSMGNWLLLESLRRQAERDGRVSEKISTVIMAAADVDVDVFKTEMEHLGAARPHFMLFVSENDGALRASRAFWGGVQRLGAIDPRIEPYKSELKRYDIVAFDLKNFPTNGAFGHDRYGLPTVARFIGQRLIAGQDLASSPQDLKQSFGRFTDNALATVDSATTLALGAPQSLMGALSNQP